MINIHIGKGVVAENVPEALIKKVEKDLTFDNPDYLNAVKYGKFISANTPSHLLLYEVEGKDCWFPRGYIHPFLCYLKKKKIKYRIHDKSLVFREINIKFYGKLRRYQKDAIPHLMGFPNGILEADTGAGKTVIMLYMIAMRKQPTIIIVHSKELLYQWQERIKEFLHYDCGLVGDNNFKVKEITVGIINSVRNKIDQLKGKFGHIQLDECHRAVTWSETIAEFKARYYLGASATPWRSDNLGKAIFAIIGPHRHKVDPDVLKRTGAVLVPDIHRIRTNFDYMFLNDYSSMITALTEDTNRNMLIAKEIRKDFVKHGENILIISDRVGHLETLCKLTEELYGIKGHVLVGKTKSNDRRNILDDIKSGAVNLLYASGSLISEGFDAPELSALFSTTPVKFSGKLLQGVGRILRPKKDKQPRLFDFRDDKVSVLQWSGIHRDRIYKKKGWK